MTDGDQRDRAIEQMLRRGAGARASADAGAGTGAGASEACVDGETLAAWSSGALTRSEAVRVEEHLADCDRCRATLAAFARTEPISAPPAPWWQRAQIRWLVPLATAATIAAIWVAVPQRNEVPPLVVEPRAPLEAERRDAPVESVPVQPAPMLRDQAPTPTAQTAAPKRETGAAQERKELSAVSRDNAAAASGATDRLAGPERNRSAARSEPPPAPAAPSAPPPPRALEETVTVARETQQLLAKAATEFASPDGTTRWRIIDGQVQRSTTQGKSWDAVRLPSAATITGGHSPAPSVAWLAGRGGVIFVTTDGVLFERLPFPSSLDLASVVAVDDRQATVTAVDGRMFRTTNRGATWAQP